MTFFIQTFFIRDKVYMQQNLYKHHLYVTNFIRDKVYTVTKFIRNKIYTVTKFIQTLFIRLQNLYITKFIQNIIYTGTKLRHDYHWGFLLPFSFIHLKSLKIVYVST